MEHEAEVTEQKVAKAAKGTRSRLSVDPKHESKIPSRPSRPSVESLMHPLFRRADELSHVAIGAAIEVHRLMGPGLIESIYERCFLHELSLSRLSAVNQRLVRIEYKGLTFEEPLRCDVLIEACLLVELKAVREVLPIHKAQLLSYMKLLNVPVGLLINFHVMKLVDGVTRMILAGADE